MSMTENAPLASASASANALFNFEEETAIIQSLIHTPLHFPQREKKVYKKTQVFNTESLKFEELEQPERCSVCCDDVNMKYVSKGCPCSVIVCKDCVDGLIKSYDNVFDGGVQKYRVCCNCRSRDFMPEIRTETINTLIAIHPMDINDNAVRIYRNEVKALRNMEENHNYYVKEFSGLEFRNMTTEQAIYWNVSSFLCEDILEDEIHNQSKRFYITDYKITERMNVINRQNESVMDCISSATYDYLYRADDCYKVYSVAVYTEDTLHDLLADCVAENPFSFPQWFIYDCCLKRDFKRHLSGINDPIFCSIYESDNNDFLTELLDTPQNLLDAVKRFFHQLDVCEILGREEMRVTTLTYYDSNKDEVVSEEVFLLYDVSNPAFYRTNI